MKEKTENSPRTETAPITNEQTGIMPKAKNTPKRKDKILLAITKSNFGGASRYVFELASRLKEEGYEVAVAPGGKGVLQTMLEEKGIPVFPISAAQRDISITKEFKVLWNLYKIVRTYKPTIVHLNSPKIGGLGAVAARLASVVNSTVGGKDKESGEHYFVKKIIYTNHGWPFNERRPEWQQFLIRVFSWLTVFLGGTTIVLSKTERNDALKWPLVQHKFVTIGNGVVPFVAKEKREALMRLVGSEKADQWIAEGRTVIGTISELHRNKGLTYALEGLNMYTDQYPDKKIAYVVIGEGEMRTEIENLIEKNTKKSTSLRGNIILAGHVNEAREYLRAFDIFLLSSVKEGLPFAILEAGYVGVPVISTCVGGIPEVIQNLENGMLIPPGRPQEIKNALIYLDEHPEVEPRMITSFKEKIATQYNFDVIFKAIKDLYKI